MSFAAKKIVKMKTWTDYYYPVVSFYTLIYAWEQIESSKIGQLNGLTPNPFLVLSLIF